MLMSWSPDKQCKLCAQGCDGEHAHVNLLLPARSMSHKVSLLCQMQTRDATRRTFPESEECLRRLPSVLLVIVYVVVEFPPVGQVEFEGDAVRPLFLWQVLRVVAPHPAPLDDERDLVILGLLNDVVVERGRDFCRLCDVSASRAGEVRTLP